MSSSGGRSGGGSAEAPSYRCAHSVATDRRSISPRRSLSDATPEAVTPTDRDSMANEPEDLSALDDAFHLPENIEDPRLRGLYEVLVARMRREAIDLPMNTVQQLLIERIAYNYIVLRDFEAGGRFSTANAQKDFNTFWLSMTQEFNRMLTKAEAMTGSERKALLKQIQQLILTTVDKSVSDPKTRSNLLVNMAAAFEHVKI